MFLTQPPPPPRQHHLSVPSVRLTYPSVRYLWLFNTSEFINSRISVETIRSVGVSFLFVPHLHPY